MGGGGWTETTVARFSSLAMMKPRTTIPTPLVTRESLLAFTQRLVERYAPEKVILYSCGEARGYGSLARGDAVRGAPPGQDP